MRVKASLGAIALLLPGITMAGGYCAIPVLYRSVPVTVHVDHVDKGLCGIAILENERVAIEQAAARTVKGPVTCDESGSDCRRKVEYYLSMQDTDPYIVVFRGAR